MIRWKFATPSEPPSTEPSTGPVGSTLLQPLRPMLLHLAHQEAGMLQGQVDYMKPQLAQVDSLVHEAALTLEQALRTLDGSVQKQHNLVAGVQQSLQMNVEGEEAGSDDVDAVGASIMSTLNGFVDGMLEISRSSIFLVSEVEDIRERAERMQAVLGELAEIADRTHLLSLNASIEAAHAKQFGAGFAVVAGEVSKLAHRSTTLSNTIQEQITGTMAALGRTDEQVQSIASKDMNVALQSQGESGELMERLKARNEQVKELVALLAENSRIIATQVGHVVRSLQFEDLVHQTLQGCLLELDNLLEQAAAWELFESRLREGEPEAEALAILSQRLSEVESARVQAKAVKRDTLTAGDVDLF